jgi:elongation factor Ts
MSQISAAAVNELRKKTDLPLMDCKRALTEAGGDIQKAIDLLRAQNAKVGIKRGANETAEGRVGVFVEPAARTAGIVELRCESAPSAKSDQFIELAHDLARHAASAAPESVEQMMAQPYGGGTGTVEDRLNETVGLIREKMVVQRFARLTGDTFGQYTHHDGTLGVVLVCDGTPKAAADEPLRDVCAHIAALDPQFLNAADIPAATLDKEKAVILAQIQESEKAAEEKATAEGKKFTPKNASILDKIADGKLKTWMAEAVLTEQPMANTAKYPNQTVGAVLKGLGLTPVRFVRYKVGAVSA